MLESENSNMNLEIIQWKSYSLCMELLGLRSLIYPTLNLNEAKKWWITFLGVDPYFDEPFYVGFNVGGYEIGLNPGAAMEFGPITFIGVKSIEESLALAKGKGAYVESGIDEVGDGIKVAQLISPTGERFGFIFNPHFRTE